MEIQSLGLTKTYSGGVTAVRSLSFRLENGIVGLLGPNGAGKTSLMRMLATLLPPSAGTALVNGHDIRYDRAEVRATLGYLPQDFGLYPSLSVLDCLDYMAMLSGMGRRKQRRARIEEVLEQVNLCEYRKRPVGALSGGMKRRLGIAQAIVHEPGFLIFDEPTAGLDPEERIRIRNLLAELGGERVIVLSTHIVADVASAAQTILVMNRGELVYQGSASELIDMVRNRTFQVVVSPEMLPEIRSRWLVTEVQRESDGMLVRLVGEDGGQNGAVPRPPSLEDAYVWLMESRGQGPGEPADPVREPGRKGLAGLASRLRRVRR